MATPNKTTTAAPRGKAAAAATAPPAGGGEDAKKVDPSKAKGHEYPEKKVSFNSRDLLIYALGIGCDDLRFLYENHPEFSSFPTYPVVLGFKGTSQDVISFKGGSDGRVPGIPKFDPNMILHGEQYIEVLQHLPPRGGAFTQHSKILGVYDKGKGMLIETETIMRDTSGTPTTRLISSAFVRGMGGFGGAPQPKTPEIKPPARGPDAVEEFKTLPHQALTYRLSGDFNPLHADPAVAKAVGFPGPILHGLCSFGVAARHVIKRFCNGDPRRFRSMRVRFASPVFPGETLVTEMWMVSTDHSKIVLQQRVKEREVVVLSNALVEIHPGLQSRM